MPRTAKRPARAKVKSARQTSQLVPRRRRKLTPTEREALRERMREAHAKIVASGDTIDTYEDLMREIAERRGGAG